jgi:hypothetical protein
MNMKLAKETHVNSNLGPIYPNLTRYFFPLKKQQRENPPTLVFRQALETCHHLLLNLSWDACY